MNIQSTPCIVRVKKDQVTAHVFDPLSPSVVQALLWDAFGKMHSTAVVVEMSDGKAWMGPAQGNQNAITFFFSLFPGMEAAAAGIAPDSAEAVPVANVQRARVTREVVAALRALGFEPALQV